MIVKTGKVYSSRIFIPQEIRTLFNIKDGDIIIWNIEDDEKIYLTLQEKTKAKNKRYNVYSTS